MAAGPLRAAVLRLGTMESGGRLVPLQSVSGQSLGGWLVVRLVRAAASASERRGRVDGVFAPGAAGGGAALSGAASLLPLASPRDLVRMAVGLLHAVTAEAETAARVCASMSSKAPAVADDDTDATTPSKKDKKMKKDKKSSSKKRRRSDADEETAASAAGGPASALSEGLAASAAAVLEVLEGALLMQGGQGRPNAPSGFDASAFRALLRLRDLLSLLDGGTGPGTSSEAACKMNAGALCDRASSLVVAIMAGAVKAGSVRHPALQCGAQCEGLALSLLEEARRGAGTSAGAKAAGGLALLATAVPACLGTASTGSSSSSSGEGGQTGAWAGLI